MEYDLRSVTLLATFARVLERPALNCFNFCSFV